MPDHVIALYAAPGMLVLVGIALAQMIAGVVLMRTTNGWEPKTTFGILVAHYNPGAVLFSAGAIGNVIYLLVPIVAAVRGALS